MRVVGRWLPEGEPQSDSVFDRSAPAYRPIPDAAQHLLAHHEADGRDGLHHERCPAVVVGVPLPHHQSGGAVGFGVEDERPGEIVGSGWLAVRCAAPKDQGPIRFRDRDVQGHLGVDSHLVAGHDLLPLRGRCGRHCGYRSGRRRFQEVVAVRDAATLTHVFASHGHTSPTGVNGDGAGWDETGVRQEIVPARPPGPPERARWIRRCRSPARTRCRPGADDLRRSLPPAH